MSDETNLVTQEIGSFRKPEYLSSVFKKKIQEKELKQLKEKATLDTLRLFDSTGLENIGIGGEMYRWEMYEHPARRIDGIKFYGMVRSFDNRYYRKGSVVSEMSVGEHWHNDELEFVMENTGRDIKMPITGPYTLMDWSFNEKYDSRSELAIAFARLVNSEIKSMKEIWNRKYPGRKLQVQIDEPAATTRPDEMDLFVESINRSIQGIPGLESSLHVCYSTDYRNLFDVSPDLKIDGFNLEFANRDTYEVGETNEKRPAYELLKYFADIDREKFMGVGVTDVHVDTVESVELIESRIRYSLNIMEDPAKLKINPDCGLRTRSREIAKKKLENMVRAALRVRKDL